MLLSAALTRRASSESSCRGWTWRPAGGIALADRYKGIYAAVGVHPNDIGPQPRPIKLVCGISARWLITQRWWLSARSSELSLARRPTCSTPGCVPSCALAAELGLPVILHDRKSTADNLAILSEWAGAGLPEAIAARPGVLHWFSAAWEAADRAGDGFELVFPGRSHSDAERHGAWRSLAGRPGTSRNQLAILEPTAASRRAQRASLRAVCCTEAGRGSQGVARRTAGQTTRNAARCIASE